MEKITLMGEPEVIWSVNNPPTQAEIAQMNQRVKEILEGYGCAVKIVED